MKVKSETELAQLCPILSDPMDCSHQAPLSMGFSRQEYWSGVPLPSLMYSSNKLLNKYKTIVKYSIVWSQRDMGLKLCFATPRLC